MTEFDPAAATAAYLSALSPAQMAKAIAYTHGKEWLILFGWIAALVVAWLIVRTGLLVRVRDAMNGKKPRPVTTSLVLALLYFLMDFALGLPWSSYSGWWYEKSFGLTDQPFLGFLTDTLKVLPVNLILGAFFIAALYAVLRRAPKTWWIWGSAISAAFLIFGLLIAPIVIEPLLNKYTPAPAGEVRDEVVRLGKLTGTPTDKIYVYDGSKQSNRYTANVSGLGGTARVAMSDVMFKKGADLAEVRGVVGHEMGHYVHQHALWLVAGFSVIAAVAFFLTGALFPLMSRLLGAGAVKGIADPAGLPVLFAVLATLGFLGTPLLNSLTRVVEADADAFSLQYAQEPDGLAKALVKTAEYRAPSPSRLEEIVFYDHPSVESRVRRAMEWKAKHQAKAETPAPSAP